jgi:hypothetical protein
MRWLDRLTAAKPSDLYGVCVLKDAPAALAAPVSSYKPHVDRGRMAVTAILTTANADRQGDVIDPAGGDFSEHRTNPVVMFHHGKQHKLPIGKAEDRDGNYTVRLVKSADGNLLVGTTHFAQSNKFANDVFGLVAEDILRGVSIGFDPLADSDSVDEIGPSPVLKRPALHFKGWKLLEYSHTPIGVNRDALTVAVHKSLDGSHKLHPRLEAMLRPYADPRRTTVAVSGLRTVEKAMPQPDDDYDDAEAENNDAAAVPEDDDPGADAGGFDPTNDDPSADPMLQETGAGYAQPDDADGPPPTVQALTDGAQGILDLCSAVEGAMKKSEHPKGRKFASKLCADLRKTAAEAKSFADKIQAELAGGVDAAEDTAPGDDGDNDDMPPESPESTDEPEEPETDDDGAIVTKGGYVPRRWTYADLASAAPQVVHADPDANRKYKALEREHAKLKKAFENMLNDIEAAERRRS